MADEPRRHSLLGRSTGDLLVLLLAGTICGSVLAAGATIAVLLIQGADTSGAVGLLADVVNTLIGLLAGFLAGRTESARSGP